MASRCMKGTAVLPLLWPKDSRRPSCSTTWGQPYGGGEAVTIAAGTRLGRYEIRSKIGAGGTGEVIGGKTVSFIAKLH